VADVKQLDGNALVQRKIRVAAGAVKDPEKLVTALGGPSRRFTSVSLVRRWPGTAPPRVARRAASAGRKRAACGAHARRLRLA
jgi:hypothetical protein